MVRIFNRRWIAVLAATVVAAAAVLSAGPAVGATGSVVVSNQNDCTVGPTNDNFLSPGQTAYVWLTFNASTSVRGYTYEVTGTNSDFDSGILKIRFNQDPPPASPSVTLVCRPRRRRSVVASDATSRHYRRPARALLLCQGGTRFQCVEDDAD